MAKRFTRRQAVSELLGMAGYWLHAVAKERSTPARRTLQKGALLAIVMAKQINEGSGFGFHRWFPCGNPRTGRSDCIWYLMGGKRLRSLLWSRSRKNQLEAEVR